MDSMDKYLRQVRCLELQDIRDLGSQLQTKVSYTNSPFYHHILGKKMTTIFITRWRRNSNNSFLPASLFSGEFLPRKVSIWNSNLIRIEIRTDWLWWFTRVLNFMRRSRNQSIMTWSAWHLDLGLASSGCKGPWAWAYKLEEKTSYAQLLIWVI